MTRVSMGDASLTNILARQGAALRTEVQRASAEVTTGKYQDIAQALRGDVSPVLAIDASLSLSSSTSVCSFLFRTSTSFASFTLTTASCRFD